MGSLVVIHVVRVFDPAQTVHVLLTLEVILYREIMEKVKEGDKEIKLETDRHHLPLSQALSIPLSYQFPS